MYIYIYYMLQWVGSCIMEQRQGVEGGKFQEVKFSAFLKGHWGLILPRAAGGRCTLRKRRHRGSTLQAEEPSRTRFDHL